RSISRRRRSSVVSAMDNAFQNGGGEQQEEEERGHQRRHQQPFKDGLASAVDGGGKVKQIADLRAKALGRGALHAATTSLASCASIASRAASSCTRLSRTSLLVIVPSSSTLERRAAQSRTAVSAV